MPIYYPSQATQDEVSGKGAGVDLGGAFDALLKVASEHKKSSIDLFKILAKSNPELVQLAIMDNPTLLQQLTEPPHIRDLYAQKKAVEGPQPTAQPTVKTGEVSFQPNDPGTVQLPAQGPGAPQRALSPSEAVATAFRAAAEKNAANPSRLLPEKADDVRQTAALGMKHLTPTAQADQGAWETFGELTAGATPKIRAAAGAKLAKAGAFASDQTGLADKIKDIEEYAGKHGIKLSPSETLDKALGTDTETMRMIRLELGAIALAEARQDKATHGKLDANQITNYTNKISEWEKDIAKIDTEIDSLSDATAKMLEQAIPGQAESNAAKAAKLTQEKVKFLAYIDATEDIIKGGKKVPDKSSSAKGDSDKAKAAATLQKYLTK